MSQPENSKNLVMAKLSELGQVKGLPWLEFSCRQVDYWSHGIRLQALF